MHSAACGFSGKYRIHIKSKYIKWNEGSTKQTMMLPSSPSTRCGIAFEI